MSQQPQVVIVTTKNTASLTLGLIAVVIGAIALLFGWVPFVGLMAIPFALIGGTLALLGLLIALFKGFRGAGMPILGGFICLFAVLLPVLSTGGASTAISESMDDAARGMKEQQKSLEEEHQRKEQSEDTEKAAYITQNVQLYDLSAQYTESMFDGQIPGLLFKLKNAGDRSLDKVEVTVYFKDGGGAVIAEESYLPVLVTEFSFDDSAKPLKPGYVWQMEQGKFFAAKSVPTEWLEGNVEARITDIEFSK